MNKMPRQPFVVTPGGTIIELKEAIDIGKMDVEKQFPKRSKLYQGNRVYRYFEKVKNAEGV